MAKQIAELTEDLEELKSEKTMLLSSFDCSEDTGIAEVKKSVAAMEENLKRLTKQEEKYATELDNALKQYTELKEQAKEFDLIELYEARQAIRPDYERNAAQCVQNAYGEKYDWLCMVSSRKEISGLLDEYAQEQAMEKALRKQQKEQCYSKSEKKTKHREQER